LPSTVIAVDQRLSDEFQKAFWAAKRAMAEAGEAAFQRHGVRSGQQWILRCLWAEDGLSPGEIARRLDLATPTVTKAATRMEAAGLLTRRAHPHDARLVCLRLTDRGRGLEKDIADEMHQLAERALATLGEEERAALVRYLTEIRDNLHG
jgi:MarR family transcriptional regulator, organic hydroperoxide resistance regulator